MFASDLLSRRAEYTPNREALLDLGTGKRYSYAELNSRANRTANFLKDNFGLVKGDRVSILAHNCVEYLDLFYGLGKIGAIFAPLNWRLVPQELVYIVNNCQPKALICGPDFTEALAIMRSDVDIEKVFALEGANIPGAISYDDEMAKAQSSEPKRPSIDSEDPYCILYTSGTTGKPKGAIIPHRQVLWNCINTVVSWGLTENDVSPVFTPLFHAGGLFAFLTPLFYLGGRIIIAHSYDASESLQVIVNEGCTVVLGVPTLFQMWFDSPVFAEADFSNVRFFISGGAPCPPSLMQAWRDKKGVVFRQGYGLDLSQPDEASR
jgi:fatty-acyl-CoA synthase